ncbi:MAG: hypothetical protein J6S49_04545 [Erysipelotrichaceae bacterium]|nr:hypothetical protein [Erysipelotrichaceae bacterium]
MNKRKILNIVIFIIVLTTWLRMVFYASGIALTAGGLRSLRYFTVLSNLFEGIACLIWLYNKDEKIKYAAAVSVTLTMVVVLTFLGPLYGYIPMFSGVSFWMQLIVPLAALLEVIFWNKEKFTLKDNLLACIPMGIYGVYYIGNNIVNGIGQWPNSNDWYGFLTWGYPIGIMFYIVILLVVFLIGLAIRKIKDKM